MLGGDHQRGQAQHAEPIGGVHAGHRCAAAQVAFDIGGHHPAAKACHRGRVAGAKIVGEPALHARVGHRLDAAGAHRLDALAPSLRGRLGVARGRVGDHQRAHQRRLGQRQLLPDHAAHRHAHPQDRAGVEFAQQPRGVGSQIGHRVRPIGRVRAAVAAMVVADHAAVRRQPVGQRVPHRRIGSQRVAEHHHGRIGRAAAGRAHREVQRRPAGGEAGPAHAGVTAVGRVQRRQIVPRFAQDRHRVREGRVGRRHAGVDGGLDERFAQRLQRRAMLDRGAKVQVELVPAAQRGGDRQHDQAPGERIEPRAAPHLVPGVAGDEVLEVGVEGGGPVHRAVHPFIAQRGTAVAKPALQVVVVAVARAAHASTPSSQRFRSAISWAHTECCIG